MLEDVKKLDSGQPKKNRRKGSRKITKKALHNVALHYLSKYSATEESLRKVLRRRLEVSVRDYGTDASLGALWIETLIEKYNSLGYLDDFKYAENRIWALLAKGKSIRAVVLLLRRKGIDPKDIKAILKKARGELPDLDLYAATAFARRRQLGPYRAPETRREYRDGDLAKFARSGFDYEIARTIIDIESQMELEIMLTSEIPADYLLNVIGASSKKPSDG